MCCDCSNMNISIGIQPPGTCSSWRRSSTRSSGASSGRRGLGHTSRRTSSSCQSGSILRLSAGCSGSRWRPQFQRRGTLWYAEGPLPYGPRRPGAHCRMPKCPFALRATPAACAPETGILVICRYIYVNLCCRDPVTPSMLSSGLHTTI